jgi:hypothetical protein
MADRRSRRSEATLSDLAWPARSTRTPGRRAALEGAEDFDVALLDAATTVQVKDTAANVTLRPSDVKDAIENYWTIRKNNPGGKCGSAF